MANFNIDILGSEEYDDSVMIACAKKAIVYFLDHLNIENLEFTVEDIDYDLTIKDDGKIYVEHQGINTSEDDIINGGADADLMRNFICCAIMFFLLPDHGIVVFHEGKRFIVGNDGGEGMCVQPISLEETICEFEYAKLDGIRPI
jgi:hypothetical protein